MNNYIKDSTIKTCHLFRPVEQETHNSSKCNVSPQSQFMLKRQQKVDTRSLQVKKDAKICAERSNELAQSSCIQALSMSYVIKTNLSVSLFGQ